MKHGHPINKMRTYICHIIFLKKATMAKFIKSLIFLSFMALTSNAVAAPIKNQIAVFSALEKVTALIETIEIRVGETKKFGIFEVTPRACYSRPVTERPETTGFIEIDEVPTDGGDKTRVFTGWMFVSSPGLYGVEHPVYDIWLIGCKNE